VPLSILDQPQKTSFANRVGPIGNNLLSEQGIPYVTHVNHEPVEDITGQPITEAVDQTLQARDCVVATSPSFVSNLAAWALLYPLGFS
jgi:hypothetical protein